MTARRRRPAGEGGIFEYKTKAGVTRYGIKFMLPLGDGLSRQVLRRIDDNRQPWLTRDAAADALREILVKIRKQDWTEPSRQPLGEYLMTWLEGARIAPATRESYRKNIRLHVTPRIGNVALASLTPQRLAALYRELEASGRADHRKGEPLSPRTVRYVAQILHAALREAVKAGILRRNPADPDLAKPPSSRQATAPEMRPWTAPQLGAFLDWSRENSELHPAWLMLAMTGMRRGELLALRWRDIDLDSGTVSIRRSVGVVRVHGQGATLNEGPTKTGRPRVIDLDDDTVTVLRAWRRERAGMALQLGRDTAIVFGDHEGDHRHPDRFSRLFAQTLARCARDLGEAAPPVIRLHDLRHTHATILLASGVNVKVVSARLGHANSTVTLGVYAHVMPGDQKAAADRFAAAIREAKGQ
jgi:integrase